jgi:hypothetical protein
VNVPLYLERPHRTDRAIHHLSEQLDLSGQIWNAYSPEHIAEAVANRDGI